MTQGTLFQTSVALRPYQRDAVERLRALRASGLTRLLLVMPTGAGKTLTASEIVRSAVAGGRRVLFVVHLRELVEQTVRAFYSLGLSHLGVLRGDDDRVDPSAPVQIASIQTLARRERPAADVIILDESHKSLSDSYAKNVFDAYPLATIVGLTATPIRGDGRPLRERYQEIVIACSYSDMIAQKCISEPLCYRTVRNPDLTNVRKIAGDYHEGDLERVMLEVVGDVLAEWQRHAEGRKTIVFASGIAHSKEIVRQFVEAGIAAEHLDGTTPSAERNAILGRLESGTTRVVSNCAVLTEGFDMPSIRCVVLARPTASLALYMQMSGRGLRFGKEQPIVLDHGENIDRFGMPHDDRAWTIDGPAVKPKEKVTHRLCKKCYAYVRASSPTCPHCGHRQPEQEKEIPKAAVGSMVRADQATIEQAFYESSVTLARMRGFKPGMASFKFKERFGRWPPWSWSQKTKADFACDEDWQDRLASRVAAKAAREVPAEAETATATSATEDRFVDAGSEEGFGDWFDRQ